MSADSPKLPTTLTRDELYEKVWTEPMRRLADQYGISGNGLAKICDRLDIPYPPRGYWARKAAGKKVSQTPLPPPPAGKPAQVTITPSAPTPPPTAISPELIDALAAARQVTAGLTVPDRLLRPHPIVAAWIEERRRRRDDARKDPWYRRDLVPPDFEPLERRRHRFLSALFIALEKHGYVAKVDDRRGSYLEVDREPVFFTLKEKYRQMRRPLTDEEKRRGFNPKRPWKQETQATGLLQFSIETSLAPGLIRSWIETPEQPLERQLPEIAAVFLVAAPILRVRRQQYEEAEKQRQQEELRRYEERQKALQDRNRFRALLELASRWKEAKLAEEFLSALVAQGADNETIGGRSIDGWIAWGHAKIAEHDPLQAGASAIFQTLATVDQWTYREDSRLD